MRCLAHRVDALVIAYRLEIGPELEAELVERRALADELGKVEWQRPDGSAWVLKRTRAEGRYYIENGDARAIIDTNAPGRKETLPGWTLEITMRATTLARIGFEASLARSRLLAEGIAGSAAGIHEARTRRVDLAADFEDWEIRPSDADWMCKPGRAKIAIYYPKHTHPDGSDREQGETVRAYVRRRRGVTGFTIAAGSPLMARIYDKRAELEAQGDEPKREIEEELWRRGGWEGGAVTRVEFQIRGVVLDELCRDLGGLRDPSTLPSRLDRVWAYCHTRWLRIVEPDSATRLTRARSDARWRAVQALHFYAPAPEPAIRIRQRGATTLGTMVGIVLSHLAGRDALPRAPKPYDRRTGEVIEPEHAVEVLRSDQLERALEGMVEMVSQQFRTELAAQVHEAPNRWYPKLHHAISSAVARFATLDDAPPAPPAGDRDEERGSLS